MPANEEGERVGISLGAMEREQLRVRAALQRRGQAAQVVGHDRRGGVRHLITPQNSVRRKDISKPPIALSNCAPIADRCATDFARIAVNCTGIGSYGNSWAELACRSPC